MKTQKHKWVYLNSFSSCISALRAIIQQEKYRKRKWKIRKHYDAFSKETWFSVNEKVAL